MEVPRSNDHDKKKSIFFKIGSGGGGIGAVILLGGALATAALTSAFIIGKKMRTSGSKPPQQQQNKQDEANKGVDKFSDVQKLPRSTTKPKKVGFSDQIVEQAAEKPKIEINGETPTDVANNEFIIKNVIQSDEKLPRGPKNTMHKAEKESTEEGFIVKISKEMEDFSDKEITSNGMSVVDDEKNNKQVVEIKSKTDENTQEEFVLNSVDQAIEETMKNNPVTENGDYVADQNGDHIADQSEADLDVKNNEVGDLEGCPNDEVNCGETIKIDIESMLSGSAVNEQENEVAEIVEEKDFNRSDEEILVEQCEANQTDFQIVDSCGPEPIDNVAKEKNVENVREEENGAEKNEEAHLKLELISDNTIEDNVEDYDSEEEDGETDLSDESEENSTVTQDSSPLSNSEAIWPAESMPDELQQIKLVDQELTGKIGEDKVFKEVQSLPEDNFNGKNFITVESLMNTVMKNVVEKKLLIEDHLGSANVRRMMIVMLLILLSFSCSWMFGCSFVKLCLIMFFTLVLSEIHGY